MIEFIEWVVRWLEYAIVIEMENPNETKFYILKHSDTLVCIIMARAGQHDR